MPKSARSGERSKIPKKKEKEPDDDVTPVQDKSKQKKEVEEETGFSCFGFGSKKTSNLGIDHNDDDKNEKARIKALSENNLTPE
jgi:hypothetical protein